MKKILLCAVVLFAAVASNTSYNTNAREDEMSDLMKANIEALARGIKPQCYEDYLHTGCLPTNWYSSCYCGL